MNDPSQMQKAILEVTKEMNPSKYRWLLANSQQVRTNPCEGNSGQKSVQEKATTFLRRKMESSHLTIAQLSYNMGKLTGNDKSGK